MPAQSNALALDGVELLRHAKNLLAFSGGIDSSALFFLLLEYEINFDIAIIDYGIRQQSGEEVKHAKALAKQYDLACYTATAPKFTSHFEAHAREFRYDFFDSLMEVHGYDNLLTAHQLNDQLEWFLMRLTKGAGLAELIGLEPVSRRGNYTLVRPLLQYSKEELTAYLESTGHPYFIDESNTDEKYERNRFRKHFSDPLMAEFKQGISRSFNYLREDKKILAKGFSILHAEKELHILQLHTLASRTRAIDLALKKSGYLLSAAQRKETEKETSLVIGGEWAIEIQNDLLYIAPYVTASMPKKFREACRVLKIPPKIRAYLFQEHIDPHNLPAQGE